MRFRRCLLPLFALLFVFSAVPALGQDAPPAEEPAAAEVSVPIGQQIDETIALFNGKLATVLFYDVSFEAFKTVNPETGEKEGPELPFLVTWLVLGAIIFSFYHRFLTLRGFGHAIEVLRGKYTSSDDHGDVSPFRALTSALSATVGLGNIAGVAIAMQMGGPGALFWMMFLGFFGMASKFHSSTLSQLYRVRHADGTFSGGPMYYLSRGIRDRYPYLSWLGLFLGGFFAFACMLGAIGGGNMFQANQAAQSFFDTFVEPGVLSAYPETDADQIGIIRAWVNIGFGALMATVVAAVVLGGITRIGAATSKLVPFMAIVYVLACLTIIVANIAELPALIGHVLTEAFAWDSAYGGLIGVMVVGFQRAAFSSEAGLGSSAIAHAAAQTEEPAREGFVASLEPFVDTVIICFMTGMVVLITGAYTSDADGAGITLTAFKSVSITAGWFPYVLTISIILFAFSTMISWCYYGERAWGYLFGLGSVFIFRIIFVLFVWVGSVISLGAVLDTADLSILSMCLPNILGGILLASVVRNEVTHYWERLQAGHFHEKDESADGADI
ncbi:alanine/glycine:cation symporter family protein [Mucisphaera calidilacus]|uniref:Amino-acid carrier protein AlsT n=1 Tax=Mucisphaera calidilacus TaxID=2527982 RepID=A0A518BZB5_9BACT|nr:alanine/glycine:cation symporter family protein [Mucisphaera calidilacus]QDU72316.1 Amino-acid carrier protein AlsT [Mucisphaera calidilacus]